MADYCSVADLQVQIGKNAPTAGDTALLTALVTASSRAIDNFCNRPDGFIALSVAELRIYAGTGKSWMPIDECVSVSSVAVKASPTDSTYTAWGVGDWIPFKGDPTRPNFNQTPYHAIMTNPVGNYAKFTSGILNSEQSVPTVQVTAKWGYATNCPPPIKQATITQAARWWKRGEAAWADALAMGDLGQPVYRQAIDPDVKMILVLGRYVRPTV